MTKHPPENLEYSFPDWPDIEPGEWSAHGFVINYGAGHFIEVGLYREPIENDEYEGTYTLQIFDGDEVIFCQQVEFTED